MQKQEVVTLFPFHYRGMGKPSQDWVYGDLLQLHDGRKYIVDARFGACLDPNGRLLNVEAPYVVEVWPDTVGQYTQKDDVLGQRIYQGDLVVPSWSSDWTPDEAGVIFNTATMGSCGCCYDEYLGTGFMVPNIRLDDCRVIGNIHQQGGANGKGD